MGQSARRAHHRRGLRHRLDHTRLIICQHQRQHRHTIRLGQRPKHSLKRFQINHAVGRHANLTHHSAAARCILAHSRVFKIAQKQRDLAAKLTRKPMQHHSARLGPAAGKHNVLRGPANRQSNLFARRLKHPARLTARPVNRRGVRPQIKRCKHGFSRFRADRGRCIMVSVNHMARFSAIYGERIAFSRFEALWSPTTSLSNSNPERHQKGSVYQIRRECPRWLNTDMPDIRVIADDGRVSAIGHCDRLGS